MKKKVSKKPAPKLNVRIDPDILRDFKEACRASGLKIQAATERAILLWFADHNKMLKALKRADQ